MPEDGAYLRFPHLHGDLVCFVAEDDLWLAPLAPLPEADGRAPGDGSRPGDRHGGTDGRAWRLTADRTRTGPPRFSPDGKHLAYTNWRSLDPEVHLIPVDGGRPPRRLTYWGATDTEVCGWTPEGDVLAVASHGMPFAHYTWSYRLPTDGSPGSRLPWGPVAEIAVAEQDGERRTLLLTGKAPHEPAAWKRYRGGATGRLWLHGERLLPDLEGHVQSVMFVGARIAFLSDHEGVGNLYSCRSDGGDLRRHTDHDRFYARHASTDGHRVVYQCAGDLWMVDDFSHAGRPCRLDVRLGGPRAGRRTYQVPAAANLDSLAVDTTGRASAVCVRGSLYWLTHRDGPARVITDTPGVRVRMPVMLGDTGRIAYVTDAEGEDAVEVADLPRALRPRPPRRLAAGQLGRVREVTASPDGSTLAVASHDGRLLLVDVTELGDEPAGLLTGSPPGGPREPGRLRPALRRADARPGGEEDAEADAAAGTEAEGEVDEAGAGAGAGAGSGGTEEAGSGAGDGTESAAGPDGGTGATGPGTETRSGETGSGTPAGAPGHGDHAGEQGPGTASESRSGTKREQGSREVAEAGPDTGSGAVIGTPGDGGGPGAGGDGPENGGEDGEEAPGGRGGPGAVPAAHADSRVSELVKSTNGPVRDLAFSPDSRWLAWAHPGIGRSLSQIRIARLPGTGQGSGTLLDVTDGRFEDEKPVFTRDGRYLAFLSWRGFDPVYDVHTGDLSFPLGCRPYLVPLSSATPSPFALSPEGRPAAGGLDPQDAVGAGDGAAGQVLVEAEGLANRVTPFPVTASKYAALCPVAGGGLIWLRFPISGALGETFANPADTSGRPTLEHFDLAKARRTELTGSIDWYAPSGDGSRLVVNDDGDLRVVPAYEIGDADTVTHIDMRRVLHDVDPAAEWRQAYAEAGRLTETYFWDPGMSGVDWQGVLDQYRPLVERVASPDEFADLLREALGELGTSHAYVSPARRDEGPPHYQRPIGLLGAEFARTPAGEWYLARVLPGNSSDSRARSPLAGSGIPEGSVLTHVDGRPVHPLAGPGPLLAAAGGTTVELSFTRPGADADGPPRRIAVVPLINERPLRYQDWVAARREVVRELSDGRCGYLHIPDMGGSGWAQFNRDVRMEVSRPALIVDVRGNAGGHISELVIEQLSRTIMGWDLTRDAEPVSYTSNAPRGPIVALADEMTASDGDMITAAFRILGLGPVIGARTWGGVVGMTGRHRLVDGTVITVPMNAAWFDAYGWSVENHGVDPDIEVVRTPVEWAEGRYTILDTAVHTALDLLEQQPPATPPDYGQVPDRRRPPLPPRPGP